MLNKTAELVFWGIPNATRVQSNRGQPLYFFKYQSFKSEGNPLLSTELFYFYKVYMAKDLDMKSELLETSDRVFF